MAWSSHQNHRSSCQLPVVRLSASPIHPMPIEHLVGLASPFTLYLSAYLTVSCHAFFLNLVSWDLLEELAAASMSLPID